MSDRDGKMSGAGIARGLTLRAALEIMLDHLALWRTRVSDRSELVEVR